MNCKNEIFGGLDEAKMNDTGAGYDFMSSLNSFITEAVIIQKPVH